MSSGTEPLSLRQIEVFVALVDEGSFTKAARLLGLSQSTVSGHMVELEKRLDLRLVDRRNQGATLTREGEVLLDPARQVLAAERALRQKATALTGLMTGRLVLGASTIPAAWILPEVLVAFRQRYPTIAVSVRTGDSQEVLQWVEAGRADLGVVGLSPPEARFESVPLAEDRLLLVAAAGWREERTPLSLADLSRLPMIMREEGSGTREAILAAIEAATGSRRLTTVYEMGSADAVRAAVRAGLGVAFLSSLAVAGDLERGQLRAVPVEGLELRRRFHLVQRRGHQPGPAAGTFRETLLARRKDP